jgi:hypothetical protein
LPPHQKKHKHKRHRDRSYERSKSSKGHRKRKHESKRGTISPIYNIEESIVDRVINLEYTPIFDLYPPSAYETGRGIYISDDGDVSTKHRKALPPFPVDYSTWSEAADVLFQIRDEHHPKLRDSNKAYKTFIRQRFKEWNAIAVWRWDSLWRQEAARLKFPFSPTNLEFWSLHFPSISQMGIGVTPPSFRGCILCPSEYHTATVCPLRGKMFIPDTVQLTPHSPSRSSSSYERFSRKRGTGAATPRHISDISPKSSSSFSRRSKTTKFPTEGVCDYFNIPRGCKKSRCKYTHRCARCKSSSHGLATCSK